MRESPEEKTSPLLFPSGSSKPQDNPISADGSRSSLTESFREHHGNTTSTLRIPVSSAAFLVCYTAGMRAGQEDLVSIMLEKGFITSTVASKVMTAISAAYSIDPGKGT